MQRTSHRCPHCQRPLWIASDMWGLYYLCEDCGWTAEDDEDVARPEQPAAPAYLTVPKKDSAVTGGPAA